MNDLETIDEQKNLISSWSEYIAGSSLGIDGLVVDYDRTVITWIS